jgi:membrane protein required for colicin V production
MLINLPTSYDILNKQYIAFPIKNDNRMNVIDIFLFIILLIASIKGYVKGFIHELFSFLIIILGLILSFLFYKPLGSMIGIVIENRDLSLIISFILIFTFTTILLVLIRNALSNIIESLDITDINRILGLIFGAVKGAIFCTFILIFLRHHQIFKLDKLIDRSFFYQFFERFFVALLSLLPHNLRSTVMRFLGIN